ncbi:alpha-N-arabinofuranosidase [Georgenia satyanarayanai]|uniref:arabinosylfuranosidase ArfA n=1 Tax=Georgenia satyanarayanai TaxID=860221 RepID=UPI00203F31A5|nr:alpha-N-arabinofuranosidase [Georgenia satyanarayanai]MCM3659516.1 alpha-N-arabinofuranosidase [Georgenia satyanarayanai]
MPTAHLTIGAESTGDVDPRLFGSFVEHLGRAVYDGLYEPGHPAADEDGFRTDVLALVRELGVSTVRYPGGNFVSGYRWEDGVGPRDERPRRLDLAWHSLETNEIGLDEFARWAERAGLELMLAVNLGTRGVQAALDLLEYSNIRSGTALSDQRVANGAPEPHAVQMWCLGNEMDGPWQLGHATAEEYGRLAARTAQAMRQVDPSLQLVACGSSNAEMPTFGSWERTVLDHTYEDVDFISCHAYYNLRDGDLGSFLASGVNMDRFIDSVVATADHVKAVKRSDKTMMIAFDEWNVWDSDQYHAEEKHTGLQDWPVAPRLLEHSYTVADAVVVGGLLISLLKHADRVRSANLAQLVNVIAPIMTEPGGPAWRQTIFYPFATASRASRGRLLRSSLTSDRYATERHGEVDVVDTVVTRDEAAGHTTVLALNRATDTPTLLTIDLGSLGAVGDVEAVTLTDEDLMARNTVEEPERVALQPLQEVRLEGHMLTVELPAASWSAITLR